MPYVLAIHRVRCRPTACDSKRRDSDWFDRSGGADSQIRHVEVSTRSAHRQAVTREGEVIDWSMRRKYINIASVMGVDGPFLIRCPCFGNAAKRRMLKLDNYRNAMDN